MRIVCSVVAPILFCGCLGAAASDADADAPPDTSSCVPVAQACSDAGLGPPCILDLASAKNAVNWCPLFPNYRAITTTQCGGFDVVTVSFVDTAADYYYDVQTGALVAVKGEGNGPDHCFAGPLPDASLADCADAGTVRPNACPGGDDGGTNDGSNADVEPGSDAAKDSTVDGAPAADAAEGGATDDATDLGAPREGAADAADDGAVSN